MGKIQKVWRSGSESENCSFQHILTKQILLDKVVIYKYWKFLKKNFFMNILTILQASAKDIWNSILKNLSENNLLTWDYDWEKNCNFSHFLLWAATKIKPLLCVAFVNDIFLKQFPKYLGQDKINKNHPICLVPVRYN